MASRVKDENQKKHKINAYFRKSEKEFVEAYLTERNITIRQLVLQTLDFKPEEPAYLF